jgi:hypothetical protein
VPNDGDLFGNGSDHSSVTDVVAGPQGILAAGERFEGSVRQQVMWSSSDAVHWQRAVVPFIDDTEYFGQVAAWPGGFVQLTDEGGEGAVWASSDGLTWTRMGGDELFGGTARIMSAAAFGDGIVAVGSFAALPAPSCRTTEDYIFSDLRVFRPSTFLWSPAASQSAPPPTADPSDPRNLEPVPSDGILGSGGAYVDVCALDPALGPHRAYRLFFDVPQPQIVNGTSLSGEALSIVTSSSSASTAAFRHVSKLLLQPFVDIKHESRLKSGVHIGNGTREFKLRVLEVEEGDHNVFHQTAVAWRKGRVIGLVIADDQQEAVQLAEAQLAHLTSLQ